MSDFVLFILLLTISFTLRLEKTWLRGFRPGPAQTGAVQPDVFARWLKF